MLRITVWSAILNQPILLCVSSVLSTDCPREKIWILEIFRKLLILRGGGGDNFDLGEGGGASVLASVADITRKLFILRGGCGVN